MKGALAFAAISEAATGLALLIAPSLVGQMLQPLMPEPSAPQIVTPPRA